MNGRNGYNKNALKCREIYIRGCSLHRHTKYNNQNKKLFIFISLLSFPLYCLNDRLKQQKYQKKTNQIHTRTQHAFSIEKILECASLTHGWILMRFMYSNLFLFVAFALNLDKEIKKQEKKK